ncbi:ankyrin repeat domain-containing protein [Roseimicrobium sp. ORNL1]|uniref:ankyrin repeat domain-containing protein n=1 Tax=Roseimicrobium sp. ORNL1 TaxID=2711231 RepID=UPI0013E1CE3F|nr:ankyrin repeat domain-containing protein [Roseimicrobium sp. ORNL1]QIF01716.1 ankyrin repeat domain-containing protein [Roseimicrobium sp. ORNL1]
MNPSVQSILTNLKNDGLFHFIDVDEIELNGRYAFGETALHIFATRGDLEACRTLLEAGAGVNVPGEYGFTALHEAVSQGHAAVVALLLEYGSNPNLEAEHDFGNAFEMAKMIHPEVLEVLRASV